MIINGMSSQGKRGDILVPIPTTDLVEFEYDGTQKTLQLNNYDATKVEASNISATNGGSYVATFKLKNASKTKWVDGTTTDKTINWSIIIPYHIYGASWDGTSTTAWTRTDEAADFSDPVPYVAGATEYGSPFDNIMPWAGMVVSQRTGGTMVAIPKFWYKLGYASGTSGLKIQIVNKQVKGYSVSPAHMDRGDGNGERDVVYIGRYHCTNNYKSQTGTPVISIQRSFTRTYIHNLDNNIWQQDFAIRFTLWLLYLVEFADWNSQIKIGYGCGFSSSKAQYMGYTDSMPYHTGTTQSSRTIYGLGTQYRNIEGLWDNVYDWMDGCYYNDSGMNIIMNPSDFNDSSNGTSIGTPSSGYPSTFTVKNISGTFPTFIPSAANGSDSTYSCDRWDVGSSSFPILYTGGDYTNVLRTGFFQILVCSNSGWSGLVGCRIMELP